MTEEQVPETPPEEETVEDTDVKEPEPEGPERDTESAGDGD